jgi:hypothetical protein
VSISFDQQSKLAGTIAQPDIEIDRRIFLENDRAREITARHRVDRKSLLPLPREMGALAFATPVVGDETVDLGTACAIARRSVATLEVRNDQSLRDGAISPTRQAW